MIEKKCAVSGEKFVITADDLKFYAKMGVILAEDLADLESRKITDCVGLPTLCPAERQRLRFRYRNERNLFWRKCVATGKRTLSMYNRQSPVTVYDNNYWWGDSWSGLDYGRDFDFSRPFFDQFKELLYAVPHMALEVEKLTMENSEYCNCAGNLKNCYFCFNADYNEKSLYSNYINGCYECVDCYEGIGSELCYECVDVNNCYECKFVFDCVNCNNCEFSANLIGCSDCFGCVNLRNKKFYFNNVKLSEDEYKEKVLAIKEGRSLKELLNFFGQYASQSPFKYIHENRAENCTGHHLSQCKNCKDCYECEKLQDSAYCVGLKSKDSLNYNNYDVDFFGFGVSNSYNCMTVGYSINEVLNCVNCYQISESLYSYFCFQNSSNLFGCVGLKKKKFCIFNKQYSESEYFELKEKIIAHMKKTKEWGEFFPSSMSPFAYNDTVANEYFPLTEKECGARNLSWRNFEAKALYKGDSYEIPSKIEAVNDDVLQKVLVCEQSGRSYKIQKGELRFYRKMGVEIPHFHPDVRYENLMKLRSGRNLQSRNCQNCATEILSTKSSEKFEKILCEKCYLKVVD